MGITKRQLWDELVIILVKASARGTGGRLSACEAGRIVDDLIADDASPYWDGIRTDPAAPAAPAALPRDAKVLLRRVVDIYRAM